PDPWVRYFAVRALGSHRDPATAALVVERLRGDEAGHVRLAAIEILGQLGATAAIEPLLPLTTSDDPDVARAAIAAVGQSDRADVGALLESLARSREPWRRLAAIGVLARRSSGDAAATLEWIAG